MRDKAKVMETLILTNNAPYMAIVFVDSYFFL